MGRYDFKALRVHQEASHLLNSPRLTRIPPWYDTVAAVPPAQILVRPLPVQHQPKQRLSKTRKPSKMFKPQKITYEEDRLRKDFFQDHPWELARPRVILENDGRDGERHDWSRMEQSGKKVDAESVIQRQIWLLQNSREMTKAKAYDQARREFYTVRHFEDVERRVAKEEALATGAYFGKSFLDIGMELENKAYEEWRTSALKEAATLEQSRNAAQSGDPESALADASLDESELAAGLEELEEVVPAQGQDALGGSPVHPGTTEQ
ncbi:MAG: mitochondrial ribosomal small subunit component [Piccolia ochrophora]|nr:MAG: mitochondrial ribosomal small subunit component [Piccolia ochrophora]